MFKNLGLFRCGKSSAGNASLEIYDESKCEEIHPIFGWPGGKPGAG